MEIGEPSLSPIGPAGLPPRDARARQLAAPDAAPRMPADGLRLGAVTGEGTQAATLGWVKAQGDRLVDATGREVPVRGINLGGWLVQEPWMMPLVTRPKGGQPIEDAATMWRTVAQRFGAAEMNEIRGAYREAWLGDEDFARIKAAGFTTVRLPFTYENLQEPDGYKWLDWAIDRAARHGLYTILDLHGAPGGQSAEMHTGAAGENRFFQDPREVQKAAQMWRDVARRYADRPEVLGYDLLNEPMGAKSARQLYEVQDVLYRAIREVDPRHVVMFEDGYKGIDTFPRPEDYGWENVAYSVHQYKFDAKGPGDHLRALRGELAKIDRVREARNVPVFIGEFNVPGAEADTLEKAVGALREANVPWSMWTYKAVMPRAHAKNVWGLFHNQKVADPLDVRHDSAAELLRKIALMRTEHLQEMPAGRTMFQDDGATRPPARRRGLARVALLVHDRVATWWARLVDTVKSRF